MLVASSGISFCTVRPLRPQGPADERTSGSRRTRDAHAGRLFRWHVGQELTTIVALRRSGRWVLPPS